MTELVSKQLRLLFNCALIIVYQLSITNNYIFRIFTYMHIQIHTCAGINTRTRVHMRDASTYKHTHMYYINVWTWFYEYISEKSQVLFYRRWCSVVYFTSCASLVVYLTLAWTDYTVQRCSFHTLTEALHRKTKLTCFSPTYTRLLTFIWHPLTNVAYRSSIIEAVFVW